MVAFTGFSNDGYNNFANTLSNLGANLGNAYLKNQERELLSDFGKKYASGDIEGAMSAAVAMGRPELAVDIKTKLDQRAADANVLSSINGPSISPVAQTSNPNDPRGIRNLNPGNIQDGDFAKSQPGYVGSDGRFAKFDTMDHGAAANAALLQNYGQKGLNTVEGIISRYAPPSENNTKNYIMNVAHDIGVDPRQPLNLNDPAVMGKLQQSIFKIENGQNFNIGGQQQRVQVSDASGNIPQSANIDALMNRRNTIMRALSSQGISDNARQQLNTQLQDTTFQIERADRMANQNKPEVRQFGDTVYNVTGGQMSPVMKIPEAEKPANQDQGAAQTFATRMREAENIINSVDQNKKPVWQDAVGSEGIKNSALDKIPLAGRGMVSENYQRYTDAKERFITSILRDESGATIGTDEFMREERKYFPQPNDKPATIRDKAIARQNAISTLAKQGTPQFQREFFGEGNSQNQSAKTVSGNVKSAKPIPSNVLDEARAAIPRKGRDAVINLLRQQGFDTTGL